MLRAKIEPMSDSDDRGSRVRGKIEVMPARLEEAAEIATLSRDIIEAGLAWVWTPRAIAKEILRKDTEVIVARLEGTIIGFAAMRFLDDDAHLLLLGVLPGHQRGGVGRHLLEWLEKCARTAMIRRIQLQVRADNQKARAFYRALGYREARRWRGYYQGREDAILMINRLGPARSDRR
jgi:[ribosomal protein S18]-alanine N-acetyltransferase